MLVTKDANGNKIFAAIAGHSAITQLSNNCRLERAADSIGHGEAGYIDDPEAFLLYVELTSGGALTDLISAIKSDEIGKDENGAEKTVEIFATAPTKDGLYEECADFGDSRGIYRDAPIDSIPTGPGVELITIAGIWKESESLLSADEDGDTPYDKALGYAAEEIGRISIRDLARDITEEGASDGYAMPDEGEIMDDLESLKRDQEEEF